MPTPPPLGPPTNRALTDTLDLEAQRIKARRRELDTVGDNEPAFGLALSGGGIRSATFALGVLQGLAQTAAPNSATAQDLDTEPHKSLLARFDYLSTVSGGGYIGAFLGSLFVPGRLWPGTNRREAAKEAYRTLQHDPPGRIRSSDTPSPQHVRRSALAWLRENGRYLTPVNGGDLMFALALAIRNWFSVQYVIGTFIAAAFALVLLLRFGLAALWPAYGSFEAQLLPATSASVASTDAAAFHVWWSPIFAAPLLVLVLWLAPLCVGYWMTHPPRLGDDSSRPRIWSEAAVVSLAIAVVSIVIGVVAARRNAPNVHVVVPFAAAALTLLGFAWHALTRSSARSVSFHRVVMTRRLSTGLQALVALLVLAGVDTLSQSLYLAWSHAPSVSAIASPAALTAGAVWLFRAVARLADRGGLPGTLAKIPVGLIAGVAGMLLFVVIATLWGVGFHAVVWAGGAPSAPAFAAAQPYALLLAVCFAVALGLAFISGRFSGFLNLSSLHTFYSARLTRAYLGGSNGERFKKQEKPADRKRLSAAEPVPGDQIARDVYYDTLAPLHIINVTVNQTVDPAEQLVQRDRKGRPMAILPTGFSVDRWHYDFCDDVEKGIGGGLGSQKLSIGQWIGTSGAAFTTGLGRSTSLGTSIALGLANVRLGTWWSSGHGRDYSGSFERGFKGLFKTQTFLFYELTAKFHGMLREWHYLSDGGHFENTALYELLRPGRKLRFIVVCDDGADPKYEFADLANLVRLARIDYEVEIEVDEGIARHAQLGTVFATPEELAARVATPGNDDKCAVLLKAFAAADRARTQPLCHIVLLKPRVVAAAPADVHEYATTHTAFPQEPTTDQFFDQAQWESYRSLGLTIARRVFGENGRALWEHLRG